MQPPPPPAASARPRWKPAPLVSASVGLHVAGIAGLFTPAWPWSLGVLVADHALVTATGLWPRSTWLGPNLLHLPRHRPEVAITIDDGPDPEVTPAVLDLLEQHGAVATFFCPGAQVQRHAALAREIVRRGHAIGNHSQHHRHHFSVLGPRALRREIAQAQDTIAQATGVKPAFFRAPAGLRNVFLDPVLHALDLRLASWTRRGFDTRTGDAALVLHRLTRDLAAGDILLLHDRHAARTPEGRPVLLDVLPPLLATLRERGLQTVRLSPERV
ncbi:MAG: polysaccharide deacetylase family protein [Curvibacter sp.]